MDHDIRREHMHEMEEARAHLRDAEEKLRERDDIIQTLRLRVEEETTRANAAEEERDHARHELQDMRHDLGRIAGALNPVPPCEKTDDVRGDVESIIAAAVAWRKAYVLLGAERDRGSPGARPPAGPASRRDALGRARTGHLPGGRA